MDPVIIYAVFIYILLLVLIKNQPPILKPGDKIWRDGYGPNGKIEKKDVK